MTEPAVYDYAAIAASLRELEREILVCAACEGGGWECYGIGVGDPHFRECEVCHNPEGYPSP